MALSLMLRALRIANAHNESIVGSDSTLGYAPNYCVSSGVH